MDARHESAALPGQRAEQRDAEHAAGLPRRVEDAGGDAGARLFDASEQCRSERRHQQAKTAADDRQLRPDGPITGAGRDAQQCKTSECRQRCTQRDRRGGADATALPYSQFDLFRLRLFGKCLAGYWRRGDLDAGEPDRGQPRASAPPISLFALVALFFGIKYPP